MAVINIPPNGDELQHTNIMVWKFAGKPSFFCKERLQNVKDHYKVEGLQVRINKNTKRSPHHAMSFAAIKYVMSFLNNYAEENTISLPGRIPGYKRDDIKLLPSN